MGKGYSGRESRHNRGWYESGRSVTPPPRSKMGGSGSDSPCLVVAVAFLGGLAALAYTATEAIRAVAS